jgi:hypothetical protein
MKTSKRPFETAWISMTITVELSGAKFIQEMRHPVNIQCETSLSELSMAQIMQQVYAHLAQHLDGLKTR